MQPHLLESLRQRLRELKLEQYEAQLLPHARLAFDLRLGDESSGELGESRWGGAPDVPVGFEWPHSGKFPLLFLAQINLADLIEDEENPLPASGLLHFFADFESDAYLVRLLKAGAELHPAAVPEDANFNDDVFGPRRMTLEPRADLPHWATNDFGELTRDFSEEEHEAYSQLALSDVYATTPARQSLAGQLLGHSAGIGYDPREDAFVVREHNPDWLYDYGKRDQLDMSGAKRWQNLLRFDSVLDLLIGDAGYYNFLIHEDDLKRLDFSRVYTSLESS